MLMDARPEDRMRFLAGIMEGVRPAYHQTQEGDPELQTILHRELPQRYVQHKRAERENN